MTSHEEYYIKTEEHIEYLEDAKEEPDFESRQFVFENDTAKCGEVMVGYQGEFTFICVLCMQPFIELRSFGNHIKDLHLRSHNALNTVSIGSDRSRGPECGEISNISIQRDRKPESQLPASLTEANTIQKELEIQSLDTIVTPECIINEDSRYDDSSCEESTPDAIGGIEEFVCKICGSSYRARSSYMRHMKYKHPEQARNQIRCKYCDKEFEGELQLEAHDCTRKGRMLYVCAYCPKVFDTRQDRQSHVNEHIIDRPYKCSHCPKTFALPKYLERHISVHLRSGTSQNDSTTVAIENDSAMDPLCAQSNISVSPQREINPTSSPLIPTNDPNPIQKELEIDIVAASDTNDNEGSKNEERAPVAIFLNSTKVEEFVCTVCGCGYQAKSSYQRHMKKMHPELVPVEKVCKYCDKEFDDLVQLKTHLRTHTGPKRFVCPFCPKLFDTREFRQSHINAHKGERPYKCTRCPKTFTFLNYLKRHISVHLKSDTSQKDSTAVSTEEDGDRDQLCAQSRISVSPQRDISPESSTLLPTSAPNPIQKEHEIDILDTVAASDTNDNEDSKNEECIPVAIFLNPTKVEEFVCTVCGCGYHAKSSYRRHMRKMHPELVPVQKICKYCDEEFDDLVQLKTHLRTHTGPKRFVCPFCSKLFNDRDSRQAHINVHKGERPYKCPHCPKTFAQTNNLNKHKRKYHTATNQIESKPEHEKKIVDTVASCKETPPVATFVNSVPDGEYGCGYCGRSYTAKTSFRRHMKKMHPDIKEDAWVCVENSCTNWEESTSAAPKQGEFLCKLCGRSYNAKSSFRRHMRKDHSGEEERVPDQLSCKYCYKKFDDLIQLTTHVRAHRGRNRYICPFCPKAFNTKGSRQFHINVHTGERPYKCPLCPKGFAHQTNLAKHKRAHLKIKNYACAYCDKRFVQSVERKLHERTHTGEKPYQCEECGMRFICNARLTEHRWTHKKVKNYICTVCSKAFLSARRLRNHSIMHRSERPHHCNVCGKSFPRRKSLIAHQQLHSNEKKYVCHICGAAFAQCAGLHAHRKSHGDKL